LETGDRSTNDRNKFRTLNASWTGSNQNQQPSSSESWVAQSQRWQYLNGQMANAQDVSASGQTIAWKAPSVNEQVAARQDLNGPASGNQSRSQQIDGSGSSA